MKKLLIIALVTGALAACGDGGNNPDRMNKDADSINNPVSPDTSSMMNSDTANGRNNPNHNQDSLKYN